jgi:phage tail-like protein
VAIALLDRDLYVADGSEPTVAVIELGTGVVRHLFDVPGEPCRDFGVGPAEVALLTRRSITRHRRGSPTLEPVVDDLPTVGVALAMDSIGRLLVLVDDNGVLAFDADGRSLNPPDEPQQWLGAAPIELDDQLRFVPVPPPCPRPVSTLRFDRSGTPAPIRLGEAVSAPAFVTDGRWVSEALDSRIYRCSWHTLQVSATIPEGTRLEVSTFTAGEPLSFAALRLLPDDAWRQCARFSGPPGAELVTGAGREGAAMATSPDAALVRRRVDGTALVQSGEGRYLWVRVDLTGDGFRSATVEAIEADYPRLPLTRYLPAVFSSDDESRDFLDRFLSLAGCELERLQDEVNSVNDLYGPETVPDGSIDHLAGLLGMQLDPTWTPDQKRHLLSAVPRHHGERGTVGSLRAIIRAHLEAANGITSADLGALIVEGFRDRRRVVTHVPHRFGSPLWRRSSDSATLGPTSVLGAFPLSSRERRADEHLVAFAHRFRVVVPNALAPNLAAVAALQRTIDSERPAHTSYRLDLVDAQTLLGVQSTIGLDAYLGRRPIARLGCTRAGTSRVTPTRTSRLNGVVIGCSPHSGWGRIGYSSRLGSNWALL